MRTAAVVAGILLLLAAAGQADKMYRRDPSAQPITGLAYAGVVAALLVWAAS